MLTYVFKSNGLPLYQQIYTCLKTDILNGKLPPHTKLPSKRSFAHNHGISTITIQNAYDQLISEGYIYTIPKKGYYVAKIHMPKQPAHHLPISWNIDIPSAPSTYEIDLSNHHTSPEPFPFSIWTKLMKELMAKRSVDLMTPSPTGGISELRQAIAEHLKSFRGMLIDPDQIIVGAGTEYLYGLLIQLLGKDCSYCIETPGYTKLRDIYQQYGIRCAFAELDEHGIAMDELRRTQAQIAHISPNHHFPTGITMPANRRYEVLAWANEADDRYIIEDDYDSEFRTNGRPIPTLFSMDGCEKVIYMNTFSKSLTPTIRISYMILPVHLANQFYKQLSFYACTVSNFEQYTLASFIDGGYFEKHINRMRMHYMRQRKQIIAHIESGPLKDRCDIIENNAGLHFLIKLHTDMPDHQVTQALKDHGIHLQALSDYDLHQNRQHNHLFIINYTHIDPTRLPQACQTIADILTHQRR